MCLQIDQPSKTFYPNLHAHPYLENKREDHFVLAADKEHSWTVPDLPEEANLPVAPGWTYTNLLVVAALKSSQMVSAFGAGVREEIAGIAMFGYKDSSDYNPEIHYIHYMVTDKKRDSQTFK
nr:hypothetical protein [Lentibacillus daqui]